MRSFEGEKGNGMTEEEARKFLTVSKSVLILGTTDDDGAPMIHPVWYYFDTAGTKLYFYTEPQLRKTKNIKARSQIYFDVDYDKWPYKGVKGKGTARLVTQKERAVTFARKILARYIKEEGSLTKLVLEKIESGGYVVFEITPAYLTSWDYDKYDRNGNLSSQHLVH